MTTTAPRWPALKLAILTHYFYSTERYPGNSPSVERFTDALFAEGLIVTRADDSIDTTNEGDMVVERLCKAAAAIAERVATKKPEPVLFKFTMTSADPWPIPPADSERRFVVMSPRDLYGMQMHGGTLRDFTRQARERLEHRRREERKQEERARHQRRWDRRYDHFKRLGADLYVTGRVTRAEWKQLFDIAFARTDSLKNAPFAFEIYTALRNFKQGRPGGFREMRRAIFDVVDPRT